MFREAGKAAAAAVLTSAGPIPRHVAIVMDGNRRYADRCGLERSLGHDVGYLRLREALEWCFDLGVQVLTVFAFSAENFKRPDDEVLHLMDLAEAKIQDLLADGELLDRRQIRLQVLGDLARLPASLQSVMKHAMHRTAGYVGGLFNVCFAYTASQEIALAVNRVRASISEGLYTSRYV